MLIMTIVYLVSNETVTSIELKYLVSGHSFISRDRDPYINTPLLKNSKATHIKVSAPKPHIIPRDVNILKKIKKPLIAYVIWTTSHMQSRETKSATKRKIDLRAMCEFLQSSTDHSIYNAILEDENQYNEDE
ncbi:hypothetical protein PR048_015126 [Dryococelus australis]|uniref:Uncharacterized protein n=1 Tax=Dryococelus australis TaxID=614101 RepID=A0ABQ9HH22_9NEOP|nr:hypothetical protein PR048_015126 [Dryococelus australis]